MTHTDATALLEQWLPLARGLARKWAHRHPRHADDLESAATLALWRLAQKIARGELEADPGRPRRVAGLVRLAVKWAITAVLKHHRRCKRALVVNPFPELDPDTGEYLDPLALVADRSPDVGHDLDARDEVHSLFELAELSPRYREAALRVLGRGEPARVLAREQGCTDKRVSQVVRGAVAKLRAAAEVA
ncbi:sigma-70 family RNA polymerase sigma factor [Gemmata sp. G18]|uniref:Sigma-70 family RNA polymerase sigma factor n=1 Tax=Gemmata palustris TaxID=2822762 RepID=A0ABS5BP76_9BACT|nr:sigma-70 family RNA polymerase sigma factor [Gemmata palustris]MBP3955502.1 sigma-70 family RNA polymerase sigma factor [Gemmata palustris]